jgi:flagellar biosynthesis GTPase FlhF
MRIKSFFAPSVQSAISSARKEFGDDVTLVTSHTASLESRHLGDYEVVFAVEEPAEAEISKTVAQVIKAEPKPVAAVAPTPVEEPVIAEPAPTPAFAEIFQEAAATPLSTEQHVPEKLEQVETLLVEMGIDGGMVRALMTMIERVTAVPANAQIMVAAEPDITVVEAATAPEPEAAAPALPDLTPAELAFYLSVSVGA